MQVTCFFFFAAIILPLLFVHIVLCSEDNRASLVWQIFARVQMLIAEPVESLVTTGSPPIASSQSKPALWKSVLTLLATAVNPISLAA